MVRPENRFHERVCESKTEAEARRDKPGAQESHQEQRVRSETETLNGREVGSSERMSAR